MEVLTPLKNGNGIAQPKMVHRFKGTGHLVFKSISALSRGIGKQKKGKTSICFNGDSMNTELLFQTIHSVNQLGSTEEEKKGRRTKW